MLAAVLLINFLVICFMSSPSRRTFERAIFVVAVFDSVCCCYGGGDGCLYSYIHDILDCVGDHRALCCCSCCWSFGLVYACWCAYDTMFHRLFSFQLLTVPVNSHNHRKHTQTHSQVRVEPPMVRERDSERQWSVELTAATQTDFVRCASVCRTKTNWQ